MSTPYSRVSLLGHDGGEGLDGQVHAAAWTTVELLPVAPGLDTCGRRVDTGVLLCMRHLLESHTPLRLVSTSRATKVDA